MATRIIPLTITLAANDAQIAMTGGPLSPPSGIKWTVVELRVAMGDLGYIQFYFDSELYHTVYQSQVDQYGKPETLALDIIQPHQYRILATDLGGVGQDVVVQVVVEESPQSGA